MNDTVKPVFFAFTVFHEFCDFAEITGREYVVFSVLLSSASKNNKIKGAKIIW